tara:strand:- start:1350 stop:1526 length:177 start_codon:yes stop_codon:yes gene_type:complete
MSIKTKAVIKNIKNKIDINNEYTIIELHKILTNEYNLLKNYKEITFKLTHELPMIKKK